MTNEKRELFRKIAEFLTPDVIKKGFKEFGSEKFSFKNLIIVERDDRIRANKENSATELSGEFKLSRKQIYKVRKRK